MGEELPVIAFENDHAWEKWLEENHTLNGVWIRIYTKNSGTPSVNHDEALDVALCYGWIDGQARKFDNLSYLQKFTPRRPRSIWSKRNVENIARLEKAGRMKDAGRKAVDLAKSDGRWEKAYDSPANMILPEDFTTELMKNEKAAAFFKTLNKTNTYAIGFRLHNAKKPETRTKRIKGIIEMLEKEKKFH